MFYDNLKKICKEKGTSPTTVLKELDLSTGSTGRWKAGSAPNIVIVQKIAEHLGVSIDYLVTGVEDSKGSNYPDIDSEWIDIISRIPEEHQEMCKDFLRTHMVIPEKYADRKRG